jgi:hypothetical protein
MQKKVSLDLANHIGKADAHALIGSALQRSCRAKNTFEKNG